MALEASSYGNKNSLDQSQIIHSVQDRKEMILQLLLLFFFQLITGYSPGKFDPYFDQVQTYIHHLSKYLVN